MNALLAAIPLALWGALAVFGPLTLWRDNTGRNARNWPGLIIMDRRSPLPMAVWAQEFYESRRKARRPWEWLARFFDSGVSRDLELMGHEIEVQVASRLYETSETEHRAREARALGGYKQFRSWSPDRINRAMVERSDDARRFALKHEKTIRRHGQRR